MEGKKEVFCKDGNTYMLRILEGKKKIDDEVTTEDTGQILTIVKGGKNKLSPIMSIMAMSKFSAYWLKCRVKDDVLQEWLSNSEQSKL